MSETSQSFQQSGSTPTGRVQQEKGFFLFVFAGPHKWAGDVFLLRHARHLNSFKKEQTTHRRRVNHTRNYNDIKQPSVQYLAEAWHTIPDYPSDAPLKQDNTSADVALMLHNWCRVVLHNSDLLFMASVQAKPREAELHSFKGISPWPV